MIVSGDGRLGLEIGIKLEIGNERYRLDTGVEIGNERCDLEI